MNGGTHVKVLMSGGLDSSALAHHLKSQGYKVSGQFIKYGQGALKEELTASRKMAHHLSITLDILKIDCGQKFAAGEINGRNALLIFASLATFQNQSGLIAIGVHSGTPYYDCSPNFIQEIDEIINQYTDGKNRLIAPFIEWSKSDILNYFKSARLPIKSAYSCEIGGRTPCGTCSSCHDRRALGC